MGKIEKIAQKILDESDISYQAVASLSGQRFEGGFKRSWLLKMMLDII